MTQGLSGNAPYVAVDPNSVTDLQAKIDTFHGVAPIWLPPNSTFNGEIIIADEDTSLICENFGASDNYNNMAFIKQITINASAASKRRFYLKGLATNQLKFNCGHDFNIWGLKAENCLIKPIPTVDSSGIYFTGDADGYVSDIRFIDCTIEDYCPQNVEDKGAIYIDTADDGNGQIIFDRLVYSTKADNCRLFNCAALANISPFLVFDKMNLVNRAGDTGFEAFHIKDTSKITDIHVKNSWLETHEDVTFLHILGGNGVRASRFHMSFLGNTVSPSAGTFTLINNAAADLDWVLATTLHNGMQADLNYLKQGTFAEGTTGAVANFVFSRTLWQ